MVWALLAVLGVPIWLVAGALGAALWSRRSFARQPGVIRAKICPTTHETWPRRAVHVRVVHDVLLVNSGLARVRTEAHGIREASVDDVPPDSVPGLAHPVVLSLTPDSGPPVRLATESPLHPDLEALLHTEDRPDQEANCGRS